MAGTHVDPQVIDKIRGAFDKSNDELIAAILTAGENQKYKGMKFLTEISDADYNGVRSMYTTIGYPQYSDFVGD